MGQEVPTPVHVDKLKAFLKGYPSDKVSFLVSGFTYGFSLGFTGECLAQDCPNSKSTFLHPQVVSQKIEKERQASRIAGPFDTKPFPNLHLNPLGLVPKKNGDFRLIHNLSYAAAKGEAISVNEGIPREEAYVQYAGVDDAVKCLKACGRHSFMVKVDILQAFRQIPVRKVDYPLLGFKWKGKFFYDRCLPMGASSSCKMFEAFSSALEWILLKRLGVSYCVHCLDDFWIVEKTQVECKRSLRTFLALCVELGIPVAHEKTVGPDQTLVFLGIEIDASKMELRLPEDKILKCQNLLESNRIKRKMTLRELQSLIGSLSFACIAVPPGRAFLRRLIHLTRGIKKQHHFVTLNAEARADMSCWLEFLSHFNGRNMFLEDVWLSNTAIEMYTDSAPFGYGAIFGSRWLHHRFPLEWASLNICFLELVPIVVALYVWGGLLRNHSLLLFTDNEALVAVINKQSSPDTLIMKGIRKLVVACLKFNVRVRARHVAGAVNLKADALSRGLIEKFKILSPQSFQDPTLIPDELLPQNFIVR